MKKMKRNNKLLIFLAMFSLFSCFKKIPDGKPVTDNSETNIAKEEKKTLFVNDKLLSVLFVSRENANTQQELNDKINDELRSNFSPEAELKFKNFVYNDPPFSNNPRNSNSVVEIDNISWDVAENIRILSFTERLRVDGEIKDTRNIDLVFQVENWESENFVVKDFTYQVRENQENS